MAVLENIDQSTFVEHIPTASDRPVRTSKLPQCGLSLIVKNVHFLENFTISISKRGIKGRWA